MNDPLQRWKRRLDLIFFVVSVAPAAGFFTSSVNKNLGVPQRLAEPTRRVAVRLYEEPPQNETGFFAVNGGAKSLGVVNGDAKALWEYDTNHNGKIHPEAGFANNNHAETAGQSNGIIEQLDEAEASPPEVLHWTEMMSSQGLVEYGSTNSTIAVDSILSDEDLEQIESYWDELLPKVSYLGTEMASKVYQALCVAYRAHRGQARKSGEPFIIHPVQVGLLLADLRMDAETVMAGLLHDTVEDTDLTFIQVESLFGSTVRAIVEGETKVSKLPKLAFSEFADEQAENLRQMFVAMTDDYRIIIVKLADRLHNMRTLMHMKPEKQIKISRETLDIFAPLAHRMGIWQFKSELEDIAFMYLYPQEYKRLKRRLQDHEARYKETLDRSKEILEKQLQKDPTLSQQAAKVEVYGRTKELYSLWHKMETKGERNLENIADVVALRVIITPQLSEDPEDSEQTQKDTDRGVWLCYHVLGLAQHLPGFQPVPTRVKDYISFPKPNGYQSLHTALILNGQTIEVQIRTNLMHQVAEYGMASHWAYTHAKRVGNDDALFNTPWLSSIKEWQNDHVSARDFVESVRRELLGKRVFVFLRNGKILNLSRGATTIDAAFQIHTEVGLNMHGVEINGKPVPFSYELQNGDVVNILTGEGRPATDWMRYAKSRSTRSKLRAYFRAKQKESLREAGNILLMDYMWIHGPLIERASYLDYPFEAPTTAEGFAPFLPGRTQFTDVDDMLIAAGKHHDRMFLHKLVSQIFGVPKRLLMSAEEKRSASVPGSVAAAVHERRKRARDAAEAASSPHNLHETDPFLPGNLTDFLSPNPLGSQYSVEARLSGLDIGFEYADSEHLCEECLPIVGDEIIGTRHPEKDTGTTVHRIGCPHAQRAINQAVASQKIKSLQTWIKEKKPSDKKKTKGIDSVWLRNSKMQVWGRRAKSAEKYLASTHPVPVRLMWSDLDEEMSTFLSEVVVHAQDRKLLLADCSEIVSETVTIVKTGSQTTNEHATLIFLVSVNSLSELQSLMDRLSRVRSVLSVERRFGSELL
uniref:Putative GTP diphosphokinase RSH1, chloroplastic n=1 Tax=Amphora coffeiformis TaxID=265554 RepID=A0A7S3KZY2_9STRA